MKMTMVFLLSALVLLLEDTSRVAADVDPLLPTCKSLGGGSTYFGIDFCMSALGISDRDLSIIAVDLLTTNATSTAAKIAALIRQGGSGGGALASCQVLYGGVLQRQPGCAAAIHDGRFHEAKSSLEKSASAAKECEDGFSKTNAASPLTVEDGSAFKLAKLAVALLSFAPSSSFSDR